MFNRKLQLRVGELIAALAVLLVAGVFVTESILQPLNRDSGVFAYTGRVILQGGLPYVDSWDHKGPLIYLLDTAGLAITSNNLAGIYLLEGCILAISLYISYRLWTGIISNLWAGIVALGFVLTYFSFYRGGNLTETWLLPFSLLTYSLSACYIIRGYETSDSAQPKVVLVSIFVGVSLAVAFLTRMNNAAGLLVLASALFIVDHRHRFKAILIGMVAFFAITASVLAWIYFNGAWRALIEQYWEFNMFYTSQILIAHRLTSIWILVREMILTPLGLGLILLAVSAPFMRRSGAPRGWKYALAIFLLALLADLAAIGSSGRSYRHYAVVAIGPLDLVIVLLLARLPTLAGGVCLRDKQPLAVLLVTLCVFALSAGTAIKGADYIAGGRALTSKVSNPLKSYLVEHTSPDECVLIHGNDTRLYAAANRKSVTKFGYLGGVSRKFKGSYRKYMDEALEGRPKYIVASPRSCGLSKKRCKDHHMYAKLRLFMKANYKLEQNIGGFQFWRRTTAGPGRPCGPPF
jgi:hypothetical protein